MDIPIPILDGVRKLFPEPLTLLKFSSVSEGCINRCGNLTTSSGNFFLKWNDRHRHPDMLSKEAAGLALLRETNAIYIPHVTGHGEEADYQFLLLEFLDQQHKSSTYWEDFGRQLALLHSNRSDVFGLAHSNYIGSLVQHNAFKKNWTDFFIHERLIPQLDLAGSLILLSVRKKIDRLFQKLPSLFPNEKPSLLHGDLWSGNLIATQKGDPCIIDPAVYYGNPEMDLAMTQLFGGFDNRFLEAYNEVSPLISGYEKRFDLYNLYPLLVHVNLFGRSYLP